MAATPDTGGRGQIVWRVDRVDPGAQHGDAQPNFACRQIKMATLAKLAGLSGWWVIELLPRLEERDLIRTQGGRGAAKWIWLLRLGVPRLGKASSTELTQKEKSPEPIPGKAKAQQAEAQPKRRRQETAQSAKPVASAQVAPPVEKPVEIPKRRQKAPLPSTPPTDRSPKGPVLAPKVTPGASNGIRQPRGARRRGEAATANGTSQPHGARRRVDTATGNRTCQGGAGPQGDTAAGTKQSCGARRRARISRTSQGDAGHRSDTAACTSRSGDADCCGTANGAWQPRGARRQGHSAACNRTIQGGTGHQSDSTVSRRRGNGAATHTSGPGCAGPAASGTGGTGKTSLPAVHQKDPCQTAAKEEGRDDRRTSGLHLPATLASKSDPRFEATSHDRRRVALCSPSPLPATATFQQ